jgi:pimeloyl-ACP methyl ester carboxylesterase
MFDEPTFDSSAASFENPDFVDVVIHSYRHRHGNVAGDNRYVGIESKLALMPPIDVPTIVLHGAVDGVSPPQSSEGHSKSFTRGYERRVLDDVGHNPAQEAPTVFAQAILDLCDG